MSKRETGRDVFVNYRSDDDRFDLLPVSPTFTDLADQGPQPTPGSC